jgi:hypothetical protein
MTHCRDNESLRKSDSQPLFQLIGRGATAEAIRELVAIPPQTKLLLRAYASGHPEERQGIERSIELRQRVSEELERQNREQRADLETRHSKQLNDFAS